MWGNLLGTVMTYLVGRMADFARWAAALAANPWTWVALAAAGIAYLTYTMVTGTQAAKNFIGAISTQIASDNASQAILDINSSVKALDTQITQVGPHIQSLNEQTSHLQTVAGKNLEAAFHSLMNLDIGGYFGHMGAAVGAAAKSFGSWFGLITASVGKTGDINAYKGAIVSLTGEQKNLFTETGKLMTQGNAFGVRIGSYSQALALMNVAGIQAGDSLSTMNAKIQNLITGYQGLSASSGYVATAVDAVTFAAEQQNSKVQQLTQGFSAFLGMVTGGESAFTAFANQLNSIQQAAGGAAATLTTSNGRASVALRGTGQRGSGRPGQY